MAGKGWDVTCAGGEGTEILTATLDAIPPHYVVRVEWDDEDGEEQVGDYKLWADPDSSIVQLQPWYEEADAGPPVLIRIDAIRSVTIY